MVIKFLFLKISLLGKFLKSIIKRKFAKKTKWKFLFLEL
uniref:Uncharacterized protein n=1 Tax=virus sp. ctkyY8 TaxID=2827995 RepID=A0A8S5REG4_9VIRU|nr:MAG TPA: hypothetical protein [virus sp. ctkyY8]